MLLAALTAESAVSSRGQWMILILYIQVTFSVGGWLQEECSSGSYTLLLATTTTKSWLTMFESSEWYGRSPVLVLQPYMFLCRNICSLVSEGTSSFSYFRTLRIKLFSGRWQLAAMVCKEEKTKHFVLWGCMWLMTEVCVAVGTLGAATDQSSCKTNLTLNSPPPHLLPPSPPSNLQLLTAKCTQHDTVLINHPKQSMFNLWRAGLTRKFITCCRKTACVPLSQASIYLWESRKMLEGQSV